MTLIRKDVLTAVLTLLVVIVSGFGFFLQVLAWAVLRKETPLSLFLMALLTFSLRYVVLSIIEMESSGRWSAYQLVPAWAGGGPQSASADERYAVMNLIFPSLRHDSDYPSGRIGEDLDSSVFGQIPGSAKRLRKWILEGLSVTAIILTALTVALLCASVLLEWPSTVRRHNFTISAAGWNGLMAWVTLRPSIMRRQTWKLIKDVWLVAPVVPGIIMVGFGAKVGTPEWLQGVLRDGSRFAQVDSGSLGPLIGLTLFAFLASGALTKLGQIGSSDESQIPLYLFVPALAFAWIANAGAFTLMLYGALVTACAYLPA